MDMEVLAEIEKAITTIGFPIICVVFMWKKITESDAKQSALLAELTAAINILTEYIKGGGTKNV